MTVGTYMMVFGWAKKLCMLLQGWVWSLASDPTSTSLLCSGGWDNKVLLWDVAAGQRVENM